MIEYTRKKSLQTYEDTCRIASEVINKLSYKGCKIKVGEIALGEAIKVVCSSDNKTGLRTDDIPELIKEGRITVYRLERNELRRFSNLIQKLMKFNRDVETTDVLILATAMADNECSCLLTFDNKLIDNRAIGNVIANDENLKRREFKVLSEPSLKE